MKNTSNIGSKTLVEYPSLLSPLPEADLDDYKREEAFIRYALDSAAIVAITDVKGTITYVNNKFCEISGYRRDELVGQNHRLLKSGLHELKIFKDMYHQIGNGHVWHGEICNKAKDGSHYWVDTTIVPHRSTDGKIDSYTAIRFDISHQKAVEAELRNNETELDKLANSDALTGLGNRRSFQAQMNKALVVCKANRSELTLALLDIDSFKYVNDSYGHDAGDILLEKISRTLRESLEQSTFVARLGGDEFGLVFANDNQQETLATLNNLLEKIRAIPTSGINSRHCSASIGISHYPDDGQDLTSLFKAADIALYCAKSTGRNQVSVFEKQFLVHLNARVSLLEEVKIGLANGQFELFYQPIVSLLADREISFEALLRWNHPSGKILTPEHFEAALEDDQTSELIGQFVLERVFFDAIELRTLGIETDFIAINITNSDLKSDVYIKRFIELLRLTGLPASRFCIEITERMLLSRDREHVYDGLKKFHEFGVKVAFDDFGTGYASLSHLRAISIDHIKIDRSFVQNIETSFADQAIVEGIIHISHRMGKRVVAEGIETKEQLIKLHHMKCDDFQGWFFSKPKPIRELKGAVEVIKRTLVGNLCNLF